jgi:hypothetical protein
MVVNLKIVATTPGLQNLIGQLDRSQPRANTVQ